jgi:hypothetical protein
MDGVAPFVCEPRFRLGVVETNVRDSMAHPPVWTGMLAADAVMCRSNASGACVTFTLGDNAPRAYVTALSAHFTPASRTHVETAFDLLSTLMQHGTCCDARACVRNASDCRRHAEKFAFLQRAFLYVGRVLLGLRERMTPEERAEWPGTPLDVTLRRLCIAYATWLFHVSFFTHVFAADELAVVMRAGFTWTRKALDFVGRSGVAHPAQHVFDRAHYDTLTLAVLRVRLVMCTRVHAEMLAFVGARSAVPHKSSGNTDDDDGMRLTRDETGSVARFLEHLGHLRESFDDAMRLLRAFVPVGVAPELGCIAQWTRVMRTHECLTDVLLLSLACLYTQSDQPNVTIEAYRQFMESVRVWSELAQHGGEAARASACLVAFFPCEFNPFEWTKNVNAHMQRALPRIAKDVNALRAMSTMNMPLVTHIQVHFILDMNASAWTRRVDALNESATHDVSMTTVATRPALSA